MKKNKGNQFNSLLLFFVSSLNSLEKNKKINGLKFTDIYKVLISCKACNVKIDKYIEFESTE